MKRLHTRRAVSPVVATVLLVGLVIISGALVFGLLMIILTAPQQIDLDIASIGGAETTDLDSKIDTFSVEIRNVGRIAARLIDFQVYEIDLNYQTNELEFWGLNLTQSEWVFIPAGETREVQLECPSGHSQQRIVGDRVRVDISAVPDTAPNQPPYTFRSRPVVLGDTHGPVLFSEPDGGYRNSTLLPARVQIDVFNLGSENISVRIEIRPGVNISVTNSSIGSELGNWILEIDVPGSSADTIGNVTVWWDITSIPGATGETYVELLLFEDPGFIRGYRILTFDTGT